MLEIRITAVCTRLIVTLSRIQKPEGQVGIDEDSFQRACSKVKSSSNKHKLSGISQVVTVMGNRMIVSQSALLHMRRCPALLLLLHHKLDELVVWRIKSAQSITADITM